MSRSQRLGTWPLLHMVSINYAQQVLMAFADSCSFSWPSFVHAGRARRRRTDLYMHRQTASPIYPVRKPQHSCLPTLGRDRLACRYAGVGTGILEWWKYLEKKQELQLLIVGGVKALPFLTGFTSGINFTRKLLPR